MNRLLCDLLLLMFLILCGCDLPSRLHVRNATRNDITIIVPAPLRSSSSRKSDFSVESIAPGGVSDWHNASVMLESLFVGAIKDNVLQIYSVDGAFHGMNNNYELVYDEMGFTELLAQGRLSWKSFQPLSESFESACVQYVCGRLDFILVNTTGQTLLVVYFDSRSSTLKLEKVPAKNSSQTHWSFRRLTGRNDMRDCVGVVDLAENKATIIDLDRFRWNDKASPVATVVVKYDGALYVAL